MGGETGRSTRVFPASPVPFGMKSLTSNVQMEWNFGPGDKQNALCYTFPCVGGRGLLEEEEFVGKEFS